MESVGRRTFIGILGASLGAAIVGVGAPSALAEVPDKATSHMGWRSLQGQWFLLDTLTTPEVRTWDREKSDRVLSTLKGGHQAILDDLVQAGELSKELAPKLQEAYEEAVSHVYRLNNGASCYEPPPLSYEVQMMGREELVKQKVLLQEAAEKGVLTDEVRAAAELAIERDLHVFEALAGDYQADEAIADELYALFQQSDVEANPEALEAAKLLVRALSSPITGVR